MFTIYHIKLFTTQPKFGLVQIIKAFADNKLHIIWNIKFVFQRQRTGKKILFRYFDFAFLSFPTMSQVCLRWESSSQGFQDDGI